MSINCVEWSFILICLGVILLSSLVGGVVGSVIGAVSTIVMSFIYVFVMVVHIFMKINKQ